MNTEELNKIKQLFATDDLNNHVLGALLYLNNGEGRSSYNLFWLIINDRNGWFLYHHMLKDNEPDLMTYAKVIFDLTIMFQVSIYHNQLCYKFDCSYSWAGFDTFIDKPLSDRELYKYFEERFTDQIDKHCKY